MINFPVYINISKNKKIYLSMNWFRNAHYFEQNNVKKQIHEILTPQIKTLKQIPLYYSVLYIYYYKNSASDLPNAASLSSKYFNDCLQVLGIVPNDNVKYLLSEHYLVGGQDKINPRIEIHIKEYTDELSFNKFRSQLTNYFTDSSMGHRD